VLLALEKLRRSGFLSWKGLTGFVNAVRSEGSGPMALLRLAAHLHPDRTAVRDETGAISCLDLLHSVRGLAAHLQDTEGLRPGDRVALLCRNSIPAVEAIFALSRLGVDVHLWNVDMRPAQLDERMAMGGYALVLGDRDVLLGLPVPNRFKALALDDMRPAPSPPPKPGRNLPKCKPGRIVVATGGTGGKSRSVVRRPSLRAVLRPFLGLLERLELDACRRALVVTPFYHGYGLAFLFVCLFLGVEVHLARRFDTRAILERIRTHQVDAAILVPLLLKRLWREDPVTTGSLRFVLSGGARLDPDLATRIADGSGIRLFDLYGSTEAGFSILSTPEDRAARPGTMGKAIPGVTATIRDESGQILSAGQVGRICIESPWAMDNRQHAWVDTGDLARMDADAYLFLVGRADDRIVSGGENVHPDDVERILETCPGVHEAVVLGVEDSEFGQRLAAFVALIPGSDLDEARILAWLKPRVARFELPARVRILPEIPLTAIGKIDRPKLRES
jgi:acyl-CoA synthetase (AMP-forming)/AMP-acid ligase II